MVDIYLAQDRVKSWALVTVICGVLKAEDTTAKDSFGIQL